MGISSFQPGIPLDPSKPDENASWEMTLETLNSELSEIGVEQCYVHRTAAFLFAAVHNGLPLLLVGPAGHMLADALSVSLYGATSAVLDASLPYDPKNLLDAENCEDQLITVINVFAGNWLIPLAEHLQNTKKQYILVHPFPEDLQMEPHSLYRCVHPVFTEILFRERKTPDFLGGKNLQDYRRFQSEKTNLSGTMFSGLPVTGLYVKRISRVLADAQQMLGKEDPELSMLFAGFPYAYATGHTEWISEKMKTVPTLSKDTIQKISSFLEL